MSKAVEAEVRQLYHDPDPCPACGGDMVEVDVKPTCEFRYKVRCIECGHTGKPGFIRSAAVMFWNREENDG